MHARMNKYAQIALKATELAKKTQMHPARAWEAIATKTFTNKPSAQIKGCPKSAFLGLAQAGLIKGVPPGSYTQSKLNSLYALAAVALLQEDASWSQKTKKEMWEQVAEADGKKAHNSQIDVVLALWNNDDLIRTKT